MGSTVFSRSSLFYFSLRLTALAAGIKSIPAAKHRFPLTFKAVHESFKTSF